MIISIETPASKKTPFPMLIDIHWSHQRGHFIMSPIIKWEGGDNFIRFNYFFTIFIVYK